MPSLNQSSADPWILTAQEVSQRLRLPLTTVYYLAKQGEIPAFQIGRSWRFRKEDIEHIEQETGGKSRVLVVDGDRNTQSLVKDALESRGCRVTETAGVEGALEALRGERFDVLLIDYQKRGHAVTELITKLRGEYDMNKMVLMAAFPDLMEEKDLQGFGTITLLSKPISADQIVNCVERITGKTLPKNR